MVRINGSKTFEFWIFLASYVDFPLNVEPCQSTDPPVLSPGSHESPLRACPSPFQALPPSPHLQLMAAVTRCSPCSTITFCQAVLHKDTSNTSKHLINTLACQRSAHNPITAPGGRFPPLQRSSDPSKQGKPWEQSWGGTVCFTPGNHPALYLLQLPQLCIQARHPNKSV